MVEVREILARPTVKTVVAEFRFPHLLVIEQKVADIQLALIERFPELRVQFQFSVLIGDPTKLSSPDSLPPQLRQQTAPTSKMWEFDSKEGEILRLATNSISLTSTAHKTYNHDGGGKKFRELIDFTSSRILGVVRVPFFERVGLRYIDECPFQPDNGAFRRWYDVELPIDRYPLPTVEEMYSATRSKIGESFLFRQVAIRRTAAGDTFTLDYDAYRMAVSTSNLLATTDELHDVIIRQYGNDITADFLEYMRQG
jgi:uncharacterized protein (TIGR04255 family)